MDREDVVVTLHSFNPRDSLEYSENFYGERNARFYYSPDVIEIDEFMKTSGLSDYYSFFFKDYEEPVCLHDDASFLPLFGRINLTPFFFKGKMYRGFNSFRTNIFLDGVMQDIVGGHEGIGVKAIYKNANWSVYLIDVATKLTQLTKLPTKDSEIYKVIDEISGIAKFLYSKLVGGGSIYISDGKIIWLPEPETIRMRLEDIENRTVNLSTQMDRARGRPPYDKMSEYIDDKLGPNPDSEKINIGEYSLENFDIEDEDLDKIEEILEPFYSEEEIYRPGYRRERMSKHYKSEFFFYLEIIITQLFLGDELTFIDEMKMNIFKSKGYIRYPLDFFCNTEDEAIELAGRILNDVSILNNYESLREEIKSKADLRQFHVGDFDYDLKNYWNPDTHPEKRIIKSLTRGYDIAVERESIQIDEYIKSYGTQDIMARIKIVNYVFSIDMIRKIISDRLKSEGKNFYSNYMTRLNKVTVSETDLNFPKCAAYKYCLINGIEFRSRDIINVFYNTPLSTIAETTDKANLSIFSQKDLKLIKDLLSGRILFYTFYKNLSRKAFIALSSSDTFLEMYELEDRRRDTNIIFSFGQPLFRQLHSK